LQKKKNFREQESEKVHGKLAYRKRKEEEQEAEREVSLFVSSPNSVIKEALESLNGTSEI